MQQLFYFWVAARTFLAGEVFQDFLFLFSTYNVWYLGANLPLPFPEITNFLFNKQIFQVLEWDRVLDSRQSGFHKVASIKMTFLKGKAEAWLSTVAFQFMS